MLNVLDLEVGEILRLVLIYNDPIDSQAQAQNDQCVCGIIGFPDILTICILRIMLLSLLRLWCFSANPAPLTFLILSSWL